MKLSIIVPVYNVADYLPKCMSSLLTQDLEDCEILLIDDGSTDGRSGALCDEYARKSPSLVRVIHQENGGLGAARNTGLTHARGEYLLFVDSDDYLADGTLRTLAPAMDQGMDVVIFRFLYERDGAVIPAAQDELPFGRSVRLAELPSLLLAPPNACNKLWRRSLFTENHICFPVGLWYEDMATTAKLLARAEKILPIRDALYYYVLRDGSITHNRNMTRNLEIIPAVKEIMDWYRAEGLYAFYRKEFEALTVSNVLLDASVRVLKMDGPFDSAERAQQVQILDTLRDFTFREFPDWPQSPYLKRLSRRHRVILRLLRYRRYRTIRRIFRSAAILKGEKAL